MKRILLKDSAGNVCMLDNVYPVGSVYLSVNNTDPGTLFGGTWQRIKDVFLLAAGDTYTAGATGGAAEHILTVDEMPAHNHTLLNRGGGWHTTICRRILLFICGSGQHNASRAGKAAA